MNGTSKVDPTVDHEPEASEAVSVETLIEAVSIDGMCGVY
jgi:mycofactocin precursor